MCARSSEMAKKYRTLYVSVLDALKANCCIANYVIEGHDVRVEWIDGGFERAFEAFKANPHAPYGLKKRDEVAVFTMVLGKKDQKKVFDDYLIAGIKQRYGLK